MAAESIEIKLLVDGEQAATRALNNVTGQMSKLDTAQKQAATSAKAQTVSFGAATQSAAKFQSTIGIAAQAVGTFSSSGSKMVSVLGQTAGAMATVAGSMGPLGIAIVGVTSAAGFMAAAFADSASEAEKAKQKVDDLVPSLNEFISKIRELRNEEALRSRVERGRGTEEQQRGFLEEAESGYTTARANVIRAERARAGATNTIDRVRATEELNRLREIERSASADRDRAQRLWELAAEESAQAVRLGQENRDLQNEIEDLISSGAVGRDARGGARATRDRYANADASGFNPFSYRNIQGIRGGPGKSLDQLMTGGEADTGFIGDLAKSGKSDLEAYNEELERTAQNYEQLTETIGGPMVDAFDAMVNAQGNVGKALQASFKASLAGISKTEAVKGLSELAAGFGQLAIGNAPSATSHFEASGLHFAAAALAGGVSAAIPGGGGGGRGGGGRAAGPTAAGQGGGGYDGPSTIVVNWNQPAVLASSYADAGKQIQRAIREAEGRYGK